MAQLEARPKFTRSRENGNGHGQTRDTLGTAGQRAAVSCPVSRLAQATYSAKPLRISVSGS